uniref:Uncharacterized protein n=1 Tax=Anguilla anguilla TaxID=7936 RepID=A0A0E9TUZ9_ANGAN
MPSVIPINLLNYSRLHSECHVGNHMRNPLYLH